MDNSTSDRKCCTFCHIEFPRTSEYFYKHKSSKDGLASRCKSCIDQSVKKWQSTHKDQVDGYKKKYKITHRDEVLASCREFAHERYQAEPELMRERARLSSKAHPESKRRSEAKRRERAKSRIRTHDSPDVKLQYKSQKGRCWHCGKEISGDNWQVDHLIPLSRGGSNAPENLVISCPECNISKRDKLPQEWNGRLF